MVHRVDPVYTSALFDVLFAWENSFTTLSLCRDKVCHQIGDMEVELRSTRKTRDGANPTKAGGASSLDQERQENLSGVTCTVMDIDCLS